MWQLKIILGQFALKKIATSDKTIALWMIARRIITTEENCPPPLLPCLPNGQFPKQKYPKRKLLPKLIALTQVNSPERIFYVNSTSTILY